MRRGLVVGKFMPLHRGHQLLIEEALTECDDVTVVVYDSAIPRADNMPLKKRLGWLRDLYPQLENIVGLTDPLSPPESDSPDNAAVYMRQLKFLGKFDRFYSSEPNYEVFAHDIGAKHIILDEARELVPISGTEIRKDPYRHRAMMDPLVYGSLIQKVVFVGTESTGKSTLARQCAIEYDTLWVHEFGREVWEEQNLQGSFFDHRRMAYRQYEREQHALRNARKYLFCDTNAWTTLQWSLRSYGTADPRLVDLVERTRDEYIWVFCANDFGWLDDGVREMRNGEAAEFQNRLHHELEVMRTTHGIGYGYVAGSLETRIERVKLMLQLGTSATSWSATPEWMARHKLPAQPI